VSFLPRRKKFPEMGSDWNTSHIANILRPGTRLTLAQRSGLLFSGGSFQMNFPFAFFPLDVTSGIFRGGG
jgi:hypothetical protein